MNSNYIKKMDSNYVIYNNLLYRLHLQEQICRYYYSYFKRAYFTTITIILLLRSNNSHREFYVLQNFVKFRKIRNELLKLLNQKPPSMASSKRDKEKSRIRLTPNIIPPLFNPKRTD